MFKLLSRPPMRFLLLLPMLILPSCAPTTPPVELAQDNSCKVFGYLSWDLKDTTATVDQIRRHNARFASLCGKKKRAIT